MNPGGAPRKRPGNTFKRLPFAEVGFGLLLVVGAAITSWLGGRSAFLPEVLKPGLTGVRIFTSAIRGGAGYLQDQDRLLKENTTLKARLEEGERRLSRLAESEAEATRLRALLALRTRIPEHGRVARIIGRSPDNWHARILVDMGASEGVHTDAVVMAPEGIIGRVIQAGPHTAVIALLTDPSADGVSCINQRSRSPGVLFGEGESTLTLRYLQQQVDFRLGDELITSGMGGVYPKGLPIGHVARVTRQPSSITPQVQVVPEADLDRLEEVYILDPLSGAFQ